MIKQVIEQQGIKIQRWRLRDSIHRMDSIGVHERGDGYTEKSTMLKVQSIYRI